MGKKRNKLIKKVVAVCLSLCMVLGLMPGGLQVMKSVETQAAGESGILNNGLGGISININSAPYTTFSKYSYGQYAYTNSGCAWFASARVNQLTGQGNVIRAGTNWWNNNPYGWEKGGTNIVKAPAIVCWSGHVAIVEKIVGDTAYISEGGNWGTSDSAHGFCSIRTVSRSSIASLNSGYLGCIYLPGATTNTEPLTVPTITTNKDWYNVGETAQISWAKSSSNTDFYQYWLIIKNCDTNTQVYAGEAGSTGNVNKNSYSIKLSTKGNYLITVYAVPNTNKDALQKVSTKYINVGTDTTAPTVSNIKVSDVTAKGYKITCTVNDNTSGVSFVDFVTWTEKSGQDDMYCTSGTLNGNTATFYVSAAQHNNETGNYITHIYACDKNGNKSNGIPVATTYVADRPSNPVGWVESITGGEGCIKVKGWAFDWNNVDANLDVRVYVGGTSTSSAKYQVVKANVKRTDVNVSYGGAGNYHGFEATIKTDLTGNQPIYIYAMNVGAGTNNPCIGNKTVNITSNTVTVKPSSKPIASQMPTITIKPITSSSPTQSSAPSTHYTKPCQAYVTNKGNGIFDVILKGDKNGTDLALFDYGLVYDNTKLSVEKIEWDESFEKGYTTTDDGDAYGGMLASKDQGTYIVLGGAHFEHDTYHVPSSQNIATITFKAKEGQTTGDILLVEDSAKYNFDFSNAVGTVVSEDGLNKLLEAQVGVVYNSQELKALNIILGDVNDDKKVDLKDAQLILKVALKIQALDTKYNTAADVNEDGQVALVDAQIILKAALKIGTIEELSGKMVRVSSLDVFYEKCNNFGMSLIYRDDIEDNLGKMHDDVLLGGDYSRTYLLDGTFKELKGTMFIRKKYANTGEKASVYVYDDTTLLYEATITGGEMPIDIKVDITGVKKLVIRYSGYRDWNGLNSSSAGAFAGLANCALYR